MLTVMPRAQAIHVGSSYAEHPSEMSAELVSIQSSELPIFPTVASGNRPSAIDHPSSNVAMYPPADEWLQVPDNGFTGDQSDPVSCSSTLTISGYFYGYDASGSIRPLSWATAWIFDIDYEFDPGFGGYQTNMKIQGSVLLSDDGYLGFGPICNRDGTQSRKDIVVVVVPMSSAAEVVRLYDDISACQFLQFCDWEFIRLAYTAWSPRYDNVLDGTLNLNRRIVPEATNLDDAFRVYSLYSGVLAGWDLIANHVSPSYANIPQVEVHQLAPICWNVLNGWQTCPGEPFPHYMVSGSGCGWTQTSGPPPTEADCAEHWDDFWSQIHIDSSISAKNPFVVNHLYGHYVTQEYHNGWYPSSNSRYAGDFDEFVSCQSSPSYQLYCNVRFGYDYRNLDSAYGTRIAWAEGFADVFALAAMESRPGGTPESSIDFQRSPIDPNLPNMPWTIDLEFPSTPGVIYKERTVAAALHDIMDSGVDGSDNYAGGFSRIWQTFTQSQETTLKSFWDDWWNLFHAQHLPGQTVNPILGAQRSMRQNGFLNSETTLSVAGTTAYTVSLSWTKADDSDFAFYEVHRSNSAGFTPSGATRITTISDQSTKTYLNGGLTCGGATYYYEIVVWDTSIWRTASNKVTATTASCPPPPPCGCGGSPFVAPWNGTAYALDNNILPKSGIFSREEPNVDDYYRLQQPLVPKDGTYSLQITEFEDEHTRLDRLRLYAVDHDRDVQVGVDRAGNIYPFEHPEPPETASDNYGRDVLGVLSGEDGIYYEGWHGDFVTVSFGKVKASEARLLLKSDFGHIYKMSVIIYVSVDGAWEYVDTIHDRAQFAWEVVDLSAYVPNDDLVLRLSTTKNHRIDVAGLDTSPQHSVHVQEAVMLEASHSEVGDVFSLLGAVDGQYVNITPGQYLTVEFSIPTVLEDQRSFVLQADGWYTHRYQPYIGEDLTIDGLSAEATALLPESTPVFFWDVDIDHLVWLVGDGSTYQGWSFNHTYAQAGEFVITLEVHYADGQIATFTRVIVVQP